MKVHNESSVCDSHHCFLLFQLYLLIYTPSSHVFEVANRLLCPSQISEEVVVPWALYWEGFCGKSDSAGKNIEIG